MLVLSRHIDQRIFIGNDVVVTIVAVRGRNILVGVEAPKCVPILREELVGRDREGDR